MKFATIVLAVLLSLAGIAAANAQEREVPPGKGLEVMGDLRKAVAAAMRQQANEEAKGTAIVFRNGPWRECDVNFLGFSHHPGGSKRLKGFNPGVGGRCWLAYSPLGVKLFVEADYVKENSLGGRTLIAGGGAVYRLVGSNDLSLSGGLAAFVANYQNPRIHRNLVMAGVAPMAMIDANGWKFNVVFVPNRGPKDGRGMFAAVLMYASIPISHRILP